MAPRILSLLVGFSLAGSSASKALTISEILPENEGGLQDADQASPGWIEIHNETAAAVNLAGWRLTDDPLLLNKWTFPAQSLAAGARLVVFASGKNRAVTGAELHTNFQLDPDGEYLALVAPDGETKASEFNPFPKLRRNVSWAYASAAPVTTPVLAEGAAVKWSVPVDGSFDATWKESAFSDTAWSSGATGLGFDAATPAARIDVKTPSFAAIPPPSGWTGFNFTTVVESGTGPTTATVTVGGITTKLDAVGAGLTLAARNRSGTASDIIANTASLNNIAEDFIFASTSNYVAGTPKGMDITLSGFAANTNYSVTIYAYDRASVAPARSAIWTDPSGGASGTLNFNGSDGQLADDAAFLSRSLTLNARSNGTGQIILQGRAGPSGNTASHNVFINAIQVGNPTYASLIVTSVGAQLQGTTRSLYTRAAFPVATPAVYNTARLRVRYDDGFAAYLNGTLIASRNAPASPVWNSQATADRAKVDGMTQEVIDAPIPPGLLTSGTNVLAIQGLTQGAVDTDFLLSPALELLGTLPPGGAWYATPTPGAVNSSAFQGLVRDTVFSVDRQYVSAATATAISCPTAGAQIRYTLDGSAPTASSGLVYSAPIAIPAGANTILRAAAFVPGWIPSNVDTHSFLSMSAIAGQPSNPPGWPAAWGTNSQVNTNDGAGDGTVPANYAMDQRVVNNTEPGYSITDSLMDVPTLSLVMAPADFLGTNGIYQNPTNRGDAWERDASVELIDPAGAESGFAEQVRVEMHGNSSRTPYRMQKHSFRLSFKGGNGSAASKLLYRFFPESKQDEFNKILLRATFTDGWGLVSWNSTRYRPDDSTMTRDIWVRRSWADMGYLAGKSRFLHLVVNGLYWGVFDACEFMGADFAAENLGGQPADWHFWDLGTDYVDPDPAVTNPFEAMFNSVTSLAAATLPADIETHYQAILQYLDPVNFADYYLLHQYAEAEDWPHHNGNAFMNRVIPDSKIQWVPWDQEIALQQTGATNGHNIDRISSGAPNTTTARSPGVLWNALRKVPAWRLLVADRAHFLFNNSGPLSQSRSIARWQSVAAELDKAIVAESARWGDTATETPYGGDDLVSLGGGSAAELLARKRSRAGVPLKDPYLRNPDWTGAINYVSNTWIPDLHSSQSYGIISRLAAQNPAFWPLLRPISYSQHGGNVPPGFVLTMSTSVPAEAFIYTLDGSDPRNPQTGAIAGSLYTGQVVLNSTVTVKARAVSGVIGSGTEVWSPLTEAQFIVGTAASAANLVISEICYNPPLAEAWEFIELENISAGPIDLTGVEFTAGITYSFAPATVLAAGQRLVLARDAAAFAAKFPGVTLHGIFTGGLDNSGEQVALADALGADIRRFTYGDDTPWPNAADGNRYSMTLIAPWTNPDHAIPENWRSSVAPSGSPGAGDAVIFSGNPNADSDGDGYSDLFEYAMAGPHATAAGGSAQIYLSAGADSARVIVESSENLTGWTPMPAASLSSVSNPSGGVIVQTWALPAGVTRSFIRGRVVPR